MKRIIKLGEGELNSNGDENSIITNNYGGYFSHIPKSSYNGWCILDTKSWKLNKLIESIQPLNVGEQKESQLLLFGTRRVFDKAEDIIFTYNNSLFYNAQKINEEILLTLDNREVYSGSELGRQYKIEQDPNHIIISFKNSKGEESFISIKGIDSFEELNSWREVNYSDDKKRGTNGTFWVFDALKFKAKSYVVFSYGETKSKANTRADIAFFHFEEILNFKHSSVVESIPSFDHITDEKIKRTAKTAVWSLQSLTNSFSFNNRQLLGIYAGLPWFFQIWSRDELISLGGYVSLAEYEVDLLPITNFKEIQTKNHYFHLIKQILDRHVKNILSTGKLQNRFPYSELGSVDSFGWLGKRIEEFLISLKEQDLLFEILSDDDLNLWFKNLYQGLEYAKQNYGRQGIFANSKGETWMDTTYNDDGRVGYCIEIQALFLSIYRALILLGKTIKSDKVSKLKEEKNELISKIKLNFTNTKFSGLLVDRVWPKELNIEDKKTAEEISKIPLNNLIHDKKIRPNVFLTYYISPEILSKTEWSQVFDFYLDNLFLPWGGLSTLPQTDSLFQPTYTGQNNKSYHRGDSWFFVNNIVAISLIRIDKSKYFNFIKLILDASIKDLLENGFIGHSSEISSAVHQDSSGTGSQAWSVSTLIELIEEIYKEK